MSIDYISPEFEVIRNDPRCTRCRVCEKQCPNGVHTYDPEHGLMLSDESKCVNCQRCVSFCPTHALKIVKNDNQLRQNTNWPSAAINEIYKQAATGGVLLSSMGSPKSLPVYWDNILINASQVTNPPIDPLREPMETRVFLGKKPDAIRRNGDGTLCTDLPPQLELSVPILFSAMSYGSISYNAHKSLAQAAQQLGIYYNTGEGGLHEDFYCYGDNTIVQVASGRFGVQEKYLNTGAAIEIKMGQGAKPGIGGHLPGNKITPDVSRTRMIPEGADAISPAPHHDIYSIEDLRQLVYSLKEATQYRKPVIVKVAAAGDAQAAEQLAVTDEVLGSLDCESIPQLVVYNKCDMANAVAFDPDILLTSAKTGCGLPELLAKLDDVLGHRVRTIELVLPYDKLALADILRSRGSVAAEEYREDGVYYRGTVKIDDLHRFEEFLV